MLIELFSLAVTAEALRPKIHRKSAILLKCGQFDPKLKLKLTRCSAIAERPRCRVRYSFRQK